MGIVVSRASNADGSLACRTEQRQRSSVTEIFEPFGTRRDVWLSVFPEGWENSERQSSRRKDLVCHHDRPAFQRTWPPDPLCSSILPGGPVDSFHWQASSRPGSGGGRRGARLLCLLLRQRKPRVHGTEAPADEGGFMTKVFAAAAQGCTAALVAAILSAMCEPLVNRPGPDPGPCPAATNVSREQNLSNP